MLAGATEIDEVLDEAFDALEKAASPACVLETLEPFLSQQNLAETTHARVLLGIAVAEHRLGRWQSALPRLTEALQLSTRQNVPRLRISILETLAIVHSWRGRHSEASLYLTLALADAAVLGDSRATAGVLGALARSNLELHRWEYALQLFERQAALADGEMASVERLRLLLGEGQALAGCARYQEAAERFTTVRKNADELDLPYLVFVASRELARIHIANGQLEAASDEIRCAESIVDRSGEADYEAVSLKQVEAELALLLDPAKALGLIQSVVEHWQMSDLTSLEIEARLLQGEAALRSSDRVLATQTLRIALGKARTRGLALLERRVREAQTRIGEVGSLEIERGRTIGEDFARSDDGYVILGKIGFGSSASMYHAFDLERSREVALKLYKWTDPYHDAERSNTISQARAELEIASSILHPGVARVLAVGERVDRRLYVVQEYIPGKNLRESMRSLPYKMNSQTLLLLLQRMGMAIKAIHDAGVVHRDLKPENIVCRDPVSPVIIDLGAAAFHAASPAAPSRGTLHYAAPEQWNGEVADFAADIYAFGVIAYELITGERPATRKLSRALDVRPKGTSPPPITDAEKLASNLNTSGLIASMLSREPAKRPAAREVIESLAAESKSLMCN